MSSMNGFKQKSEYILDLNGMKDFANKLSSVVQKNCVVALFGDLGSGKTALSKLLIKSIMPKVEAVSSPTFNIVQVYEHNGMKIFHYDLYRIKSKDEIHEIGLEDSIRNGICIIEWPELALEFLPKHKTVAVYLEHTEKPDFRKVTCNYSFL